MCVGDEDGGLGSDEDAAGQGRGRKGQVGSKRGREARGTTAAPSARGAAAAKRAAAAAPMGNKRQKRGRGAVEIEYEEERELPQRQALRH